MSGAWILRLPLLVVMAGVAGLAMLIPAIHATSVGAHRTAQVFLYAGVLVLLGAAMIGIATYGQRPKNVARLQLASVVGAYLLLPLIFALPLSQAVPDTRFANAWFEMISCFTTTGATVYDTPGRLGPSLHLWRALVAWLGGLFILVTASAILTPMNLGGMEVLTGRGTGLAADGVGQTTRVPDPAERFMRYTILIAPIYGGLTLLLWFLLMVAGEVNLVALIHAMGALSTAGIGTGGDLETLRSGVFGEILIFGFLLLAVSRRFFPGMPALAPQGPLLRDAEVRLAGLIVLSVATLLFVRHFFLIGARPVEESFGQALGAFWGGLFTAVSFLTTTGYESGDWQAARDWSGLRVPGLLLMGLAIIGGGVATTAGGVKLLRVYALFRHGERELEKLIHPHSVGGSGPVARRLRREGSYFAWLFFMLFALSTAVSTLALSLSGLEFEAALVMTMAALTTTGQLADVATQTPLRYADLGDLAKTILGTMMVVGRLETLAILALLAPSNWQR